MRLLLIDYIIEHQPPSPWLDLNQLELLSDEALLQKYNEIRDVVQSIAAL